MEKEKPMSLQRHLLLRRDKEIVTLLALGFSNSQIGKRLELSRKSISNYLTDIYRKCGFNGRVNAVLSLLNSGTLKADDFVSDYVITAIPKLTSKEHEVMKALIEDSGVKSSHKEIARKIGVSTRTVRNRLYSTISKLNVDDKIAAAVNYAVYSRSREAKSA